MGDSSSDLVGRISDGLSAINALPVEGKAGVLVLSLLLLAMFFAVTSLWRWFTAWQNPGRDLNGELLLRKNNEGFVRIHKDRLNDPNFSKGAQVILTITAPNGESDTVRGVLSPYSRGKGMLDVVSLPEAEYAKFITDEFYSADQLQNFLKNDGIPKAKSVCAGSQCVAWQHPA